MPVKFTNIHHRGAGSAIACFSLGFVVYLYLFIFAQPAFAGVIVSGDVDPDDPTTWTSRTQVYVGKTGTGTLNIDDGSEVVNYYSYIGYESGSTGEVTVDGAESTWTNSNYLDIGRNGNGTLNITDGGAAINGSSYIAHYSDSTGMVTVNGNGSTWTNTENLSVGISGTLNITGGGAVTVEREASMYSEAGFSGSINFDNGTLTTGGLTCAFNSLTGTGTINTHGLVSDVDLVFDATHGLNQTLNINDNPGQNITVNLTVDGSGYMGAGHSGLGTMSISDGRVIESISGIIGHQSSSTGVVTVDGAASTWTTSHGTIVGYGGSGTLNITNGGTVDSRLWNYIGSQSGSSGVVTVDGAGSTWMHRNNLSVGVLGNGTLNITDGGAVTTGVWTCVGYEVGSSGTIHFDNGTLTTGTLLCDFDDLSGTGTINTSGLICESDLVFDATHGLNQTLNINDNPGQNVTVNLTVDGSGSMGAGYGGVGTMNISDERVIESNGGYIGYKSGSMGEVTVHGGGSKWSSIATYSYSIDRPIYVGFYGNGLLNITGGGLVSNSSGEIGSHSGSTSVVTVDGADSTWANSSGLLVAYEGSGRLNITDGGAVTVEGSTWVALEDGSSGTIHFDNGTLTTGGLGCSFRDLTGTGMIDTHGLVGDVDLVFDATHGLHRTFNINDNPGQNVTVNLTVDGSGSMGAGYEGFGTMFISDGRAVESTNGYIGYKSGSTGNVTVDGIGSTWTNSKSLYVGRSGSGTLNITGGGAVSNQRAYIGDSSGSTGEVNVDGAGSTWTNGWLYVDYNFGSATLNVSDGGLVSVSENLAIDSNSIGDAFINIYSDGILALLGDADDSLADFLELVNGTDAIRYWDNSTSDWANITTATLGDNYTLSYQSEGDLAGYTLLTVASTMAGDADGDGTADVADLGILATNYDQGDGFSWEHADFTGDGIVDVSDLGILATAYGNGCFTTMSQSVPEPNIITLLFMGAVGLLVYPCRNRR